MNDPEIQPSVSFSGLADQIAALQRQIFMLLLVLLVVSLTLASYLYYEGLVFGKEIDTLQPQATQAMGMFKAAIASMPAGGETNFLAQVVTYGKKNPDFAQQVLRKYGINVAPPPSTAPRR